MRLQPLCLDRRPTHALLQRDPAGVDTLLETSPILEVEEQRIRGRCQRSGVARRHSPLPGRPAVFDLGIDRRQHPHLLGGVDPPALARQPGAVVLAVAALRIGTAGRIGLQLRRAILTQHLVDLVAAAVGRVLQEGLLLQPGQRRQAAAGQRLGIRPCEPAATQAEPAEGVLVGLAQPAPRRLDHRGQATVALGQVAAGGAEEAQVGRDLRGDLGRGEQRGPTGGQLDRQRHAAHQAADAAHVERIGSGQPEAVLDPPRHLHEEGEGVLPAQRLVGQDGFQVRHGQPLDRIQLLFRQIQWLT